MSVAVAPMVQDSATALHDHPPVAPDRVTPIIQWLFQRAPWVMWGGVVVALVVAFFILRWCWPRRTQIATWLRTRSSAAKLALVAVVVAAAGIATSVGYQGYHFVETDKRFCNGCHIFVPSGQALVRPDTGFYTVVPRLEGKHDTISCHTCHPLKPMKEAVKLIFWMSGVRGKEIPPHGRVPRKICESCHVQGAAKETWQAIAATAGHRAHLESDSSALKGKVQCLTCHARTAHRFLPADSTCVQSGCHLTRDTEIKLGKMADQTELHCTVCHKFTKAVPALATRDSAAGALRPDLKQCFSCHKMEGLLPAFAVANDPHGGTCGMCHNPHSQINKGETRKSCTEAACHADWRKVPFHTGATHRPRAEQCVLCHQPHAARVDASDCTGCHEAVRARNPGGRLRPPLPFDTLKALHQSLAPPSPPLEPERPGKVKGDGPPGDDPPRRVLNALPALPNDTFPHPLHKKLPCLTCHLSRTGEKLTFEPPRGCQICHHQAPARADCTSCHTELPMGLEVKVSIAPAGKPARERPVVFRHEKHDTLKCTGCHTEPVTMNPMDSVTTCQGCHDKHHQAGRDCAICHRTAAIKTPHAPPARAHRACDACHPTATIAPLSPTRSFCQVCHDFGVDHHPDRECTTCHLQANPDQYRAQLLKPAKAG
jgi:hypothetical protein